MNLRTTIFLTLFVLVGFSPLPTLAKSIVINASSNVAIENEVGLYRFSLGAYIKVKTVKPSASNRFSCNLNVVPKADGLYKFQFSNNEEVEFLLTQCDESVEIKLNFDENGQLQNRSIKSTSNNQYKQLLRLIASKQSKLDSLGKVRESISKFDKKYYTKKAAAKRKIELVIKSYNSRFEKLKAKVSCDFISRILIPIFQVPSRLKSDSLASEFDNHHAFYQEHFFDNMPFNEFESLNHPAFDFQVTTYLNNYSGEFKDDFRTSCNVVLRSQMNSEVKDHMVKLFVNHYAENGDEELVNYLVETFMDGCYSNVDKSAIEQLKNLTGPAVGSTVRELIFEDELGVKQSLFNSIFSNEYTLLVFWKPECTHCQEFLKELALIEPTIRHSVNVYLVNMNHQSTSTPSVVAANPRWTNTKLDERSEVEIQKTFGIRYTPSTFLISSKGEVVAKDLKASSLKNFFLK